MQQKNQFTFNFQLTRQGSAHYLNALLTAQARGVTVKFYGAGECIDHVASETLDAFRSAALDSLVLLSDYHQLPMVATMPGYRRRDDCRSDVNPDKLDVNDEIMQIVTTTFKHDAHGNLEVIVVETTGGAITATKTTENDYGSGSLILHGESFSYAELGPLTRPTVTSHRSDDIDDQDLTRIAEFSYYTSGNAVGLLKSETIEPGVPQFELITTYEYDAWGNRQTNRFML